MFTEIHIPIEYYRQTLKRQAVINPGITFILEDEESENRDVFYYERGIVDYVNELAGESAFTEVQFYETSAKGRDREDKPEYKVKMQIAFMFSNEVNVLEYYHNSSFLEYGGAPDRAVKNAFLFAIDNYLKNNNKYNKNESKISFSDIQDSLILVSSSFSTVTSYENQTKKSITNRFIQEAMTDFLKAQLEIYLIENREEAEKIAGQLLVNKRSGSRRARIDVEKAFGERIFQTA